jgi:hypothetical protein
MLRESLLGERQVPCISSFCEWFVTIEAAEQLRAHHVIAV